jgi:hypothetical protein
MLAAIRPDDWNFALFLHVFGAMLLVGTLFAMALATVLAWRRPDDAVGLTRFSLLTLLMGVLPAYILMRVGAQWTVSKEHIPDNAGLTWLDIGYGTADAGALLILISLILGAVGLRKLRSGSGGVGFGRVVGVICILLLAAYVVAVWAMTAKPS